MLRPSPTLQGKSIQMVYSNSEDLFGEGGGKNDTDGGKDANISLKQATKPSKKRKRQDDDDDELDLATCILS